MRVALRGSAKICPEGHTTYGVVGRLSEVSLTLLLTQSAAAGQMVLGRFGAAQPCYSCRSAICPNRCPG
jgi:hypothetical protein